jgi:hypothetical protein
MKDDVVNQGDPLAQKETVKRHPAWAKGAVAAIKKLGLVEGKGSSYPSCG